MEIREAQSEATDSIGLRKLILEDYKHYGGKINLPGFRALLVQRLGAERIGRHFIVRKAWGFLYRVAKHFIRNVYGIEVHDTTQIGRRVKFGHQGGIVIHEHAKIGDDVTIRQGVTIGAAGEWNENTAPTIEPGVDIGAGVVIIGKVVVGAGSKIGPNAVIMSDIPPGSLVMAPPPRVLKFKKNET